MKQGGYEAERSGLSTAFSLPTEQPGGHEQRAYCMQFRDSLVQSFLHIITMVRIKALIYKAPSSMLDRHLHL